MCEVVEKDMYFEIERVKKLNWKIYLKFFLTKIYLKLVCILYYNKFQGYKGDHLKSSQIMTTLKHFFNRRERQYEIEKMQTPDD